MTSEKINLDKISQEYLSPDPGRLIDQKLFTLVVKQMIGWVKGPDVLEMGLGDGAWTQAIIDRFQKSHIVDASESLIEKVKIDFGNKVDYFHSLFEEFNSPKKFDTIVCSYVLEHVIDPVSVLERSKDWLKPGGELICIVPNADSLHRRLAVKMGLQENTFDLGETDKRMGHRRVYTTELMKKELTQAGLKIIQEKGLMTKLIPQSLMTGFSDELLDGLMELSQDLPVEYSAAFAFLCQKT